MPRLLISSDKVDVGCFSTERICLKSWELFVSQDDFSFSKVIQMDEYNIVDHIEHDYKVLFENFDIDIEETIIRLSPFAAVLYLIGLQSREHLVRRTIDYQSPHAIVEYPVVLRDGRKIPVFVYADEYELTSSLVEILPANYVGSG